MGFAFTYWTVVMGISFSLANGSMTLLSQAYGADDTEQLNLTIKQTLWVGTTLTAGLTILHVTLARELVSILGAGPAATEYGAIYLQVMALVFVFKFLNQTGSRVFVCANDAWTPMVFRVCGAVLNIVLNAAFIFGLGLGVFGAALGTLLATITITVALGIGLVRGSFPGLGEFPVRLRIGPPYFDAELTGQLLKIGTPLMTRRLVSRGARFVMIASVAQFGTIVVAAYTIGRQIRGLTNAPGW